MAKCQHRHVRYQEFTPRSNTHVFKDGEYVRSLGGEYGCIEEVIIIHCEDCPLERAYNTTSKSCPQWVLKLKEALEDA